MAIELITGRGGAAHIDSADIGAYQAYTVGPEIYILHGAEATLTDPNTVHVSAGEILAQGRHVRITGAGEDLAIDNGLSAYNRIDVVAFKYERDADGIESVSMVVVKGTPVAGNPSIPNMPTVGNVLDNASTAYWPLYSVRVNGLAPQTPEAIAEGNPVGGADRVVAEGTSGDWYYRQWASGKYECWMETGGLQTAYTYGGYKFVSANFNFPVEFKETPNITVTPYSGTDLFTATIFEHSKTAVGIRLCCLLNVASWCLGNIYVVGEV